MPNDRKGVLGLGVVEKVSSRVQETRAKGGPLGLGVLGKRR
jgi:hypothetical protein